LPAGATPGKVPQKANRSPSPSGAGSARVKGWSKSPPRDWQQERHGKPHREQDRIGMVRGETLGAVSGPAIRVGCVRRMAISAQEEWPPRHDAARRQGHTEPGLQASWHTSSSRPLAARSAQPPLSAGVKKPASRSCTRWKRWRSEARAIGTPRRDLTLMLCKKDQR
jgi:hypothetical protein